MEHKIIGSSEKIARLRSQIQRIAPLEDSVLIYGETGTGKECVARAIYAANPVGKFVVVDCSTLNSSLMESELFGHVKGAFTGAHASRIGLLEAANGGTVFLDEIGELPIEMQAKFLRVLQERELRPVGSVVAKKVSWRLIAATNRDLRAEVQRGRFREDLLYRLNVLKVIVPPLRDRKEDIPDLIDYFLGKRPSGCILSTEVRDVLKAASWPGNVRELQSCIARMTAQAGGPDVGISALPSTVFEESKIRASLFAASCTLNRFDAEAKAATDTAPTQTSSLADVEKEAILRALHECNGDRAATADRLGIGRTTLYRKLGRYGFKPFQREASEATSTCPKNSY